MVAIWISTQVLYESSLHTHDEHGPSFLDQLLKPTVIGIGYMTIQFQNNVSRIGYEIIQKLNREHVGDYFLMKNFNRLLNLCLIVAEIIC